MEFHDVITFDTTYLKNEYDMPFGPFVGVNHHGQSILFGCGLLSCEDIENFIWLFKTWLDCMDDQPPLGIITDQDKAMQNAVETVFPTTKHRWCLWYIMKKLLEKFGYHNEKESVFRAMHNAVHGSYSPVEFEQAWCEMLEKYDLQGNKWLANLFRDRARWVPAFVDIHFWVGMQTTQRSESMNAFFDGYVNSKTSLKLFVEQHDRALGSKAKKEYQADC